MLDSNFHVYLRFRASKHESADIFVQKKIVLSKNPKTNTLMAFNFDEVFNPDSTQEKVFETTVQPLLDAFINENENCLLFAYGVTGSGKTHTITGTPEQPGILPRLLTKLFQNIKTQTGHHENIAIQNNLSMLKDSHFCKDPLMRIDLNSLNRKMKREHSNLYQEWRKSLLNYSSNDNKRLDKNSVRYYVYMNYVEIYNTKIYDLLQCKTDPNSKLNSLNIRTDEFGRKYVYKSKHVRITNVDEALKYYLLGHLNRHSAATNLNSNSSRSHCILSLRLLKLQGGNQQVKVKENNFTIVDLAGIERLSRTDNEGVAVTETNNINKSLLALRKCFQAKQMINSERQTMVSCSTAIRESRLTWLLSHLLENAQTNISMIVCMDPSKYHFDDNFNVLVFAKQCVDIDWHYLTKALGINISEGVVWNLNDYCTDKDAAGHEPQDPNETENGSVEGYEIVKDKKYSQQTRYDEDKSLVDKIKQIKRRTILNTQKTVKYQNATPSKITLKVNKQPSVFERLYKPRYVNKVVKNSKAHMKSIKINEIKQKISHITTKIKGKLKTVKNKFNKFKSLFQPTSKKRSNIETPKLYSNYNLPAKSTFKPAWNSSTNRNTGFPKLAKILPRKTKNNSVKISVKLKKNFSILNVYNAKLSIIEEEDEEEEEEDQPQQCDVRMEGDIYSVCSLSPLSIEQPDYSSTNLDDSDSESYI